MHHENVFLKMQYFTIFYIYIYIRNLTTLIVINVILLHCCNFTGHIQKSHQKSYKTQLISQYLLMIFTNTIVMVINDIYEQRAQLSDNGLEID